MSSFKSHVILIVCTLSVTAYVYLYLFLFLFLFLFLSSSGKYEHDAAILEKFHGTCFCMSANEYWQPYGITSAKYGDEYLTNAYGYIFFPLVSFDQRFWHPTRTVKHQIAKYAEFRAWYQQQEKLRQERKKQHQ